MLVEKRTNPQKIYRLLGYYKSKHKLFLTKIHVLAKLSFTGIYLLQENTAHKRKKKKETQLYLNLKKKKKRMKETKLSQLVAILFLKS